MSVLGCFVLVALLSSRQIAEPDLGFHLKGGQWMAENHRFFTTDTYTYSLTGHPYLDIHWLYQLVLYGLYQLAGYPALTLLNVLLLVLLFYVMFLRLRLAGSPYWMCALLLLIAALASEIRFKVRPEVFSWALMGLTLYVLESHARRKKDLLFLLPWIHLLWANVEGLFGTGWAVMGIFLAGEWFHTRRLDRRLLKFSLLSVGICLLNPNFLQGALYPLSNLATLGSSSPFHRAIGELKSPFLLSATAHSPFLPEVSLWTYKSYSLFLLLVMAATFKRRKAWEILLSLAFFGISAVAFRNIPLFILATLPVAAAGLNDLSWKWWKKAQGSVLSKPLAPLFFNLCLILFAARVLTNAYYLSDRRSDRFGWGLNPERIPIQGTQFLADQHLDGRILNQDLCGGWLDWKGPQKTFVDGRLEVMGPDFYEEYLTAYRGGLEKLAQKYQADILFFSPADCNWAVEMGRTRDWRLAYLDGLVAIYLRNGYAPQVPALDIDKTFRGPAPGETLPPRYPPWRGWWEGFVKPQFFPSDLYNEANFFAQTGDQPAAEGLLRRAIQRTDGRYWEFYFRLSQMGVEVPGYPGL